MKTPLTGLTGFRLLLLFTFLILTTNSCRKDNLNQGYSTDTPVNIFDDLFANLKAENRIDADEVSTLIARTLPSDLREQVHLNTAQQNVVNGKHVIRINISPDAYLFFSKEYGQLKAWMYSWHYASNDHKAVTGQLLSYSFQDSKLYGLIYKNNVITRWGYLETGLPKVEQGTKKIQSIFGAGFFKALWCVCVNRPRLE